MQYFREAINDASKRSWHGTLTILATLGTGILSSHSSAVAKFFPEFSRIFGIGFNSWKLRRNSRRADEAGRERVRGGERGAIGGGNSSAKKVSSRRKSAEMESRKQMAKLTLLNWGQGVCAGGGT